jgi:hypothetical protein
MARCRARVCSLSLSLFPLKSLSRFEEVGVFISCAYLFCLCGKKLFTKLLLFFFVLFQKGGRQTKEKFSSLSSFLDTEAITQRKKEYRVLFTATRSIAQTNALRERERERER